MRAAAAKAVKYANGTSPSQTSTATSTNGTKHHDTTKDSGGMHKTDSSYWRRMSHAAAASAKANGGVCSYVVTTYEHTCLRTCMRVTRG